MSSIIKVVATSDLHFGHPKLDSYRLYQKLQKYLYPELKDAHMLILAGDIYHDITTVNSKTHRSASMFINELIHMASRSGMVIRILHGTYSHDRDQLDIINDLIPDNTDVKVINEIAVETISHFKNIHHPTTFAYIPDNLPYKKSDEAIAHLKKVMMLSNVKKVDCIIGHGEFAHVLPSHCLTLPPCLYTVDQFKNVTDGQMIFGHHHIPSNRKNMTYCGSFDRMQHGEEEDKGFCTFEVDLDSNKWKHRFVKNPEATPFYTIRPKGDDIDEISEDFLHQLNDKFPDSVGHVRCMHYDSEIRAILAKICYQQKPEMSYTHKSSGDVDHVEMNMDDIYLEFEDVRPTIDNLGELVYQFLEENKYLDEVSKEDIISSVNILLNK